MLHRKLPVFAAALWWGSLSVMGFIAVPLLFAHLPSTALAGQMAARLFAAQTMVSIAACACLLVLSQRKYAEKPEPWAQAAMVFVVAGLLLALLQQYGVAPRIVARENLRLWHSVGSLMVLGQWLCAGAILWRLSSRPKA